LTKPSTHRALAAAGAAVLAVFAVSAQETAATYQGEAAEQFLLTARVRDLKDVGDGVTRPRKATLELNGVRRFAIFKTIDVMKPGVVPAELGGHAPDFQDSWRFEIAAYVIDRIIGLGMVPATVARTINRKDGSLQWWVESMMTESTRVQQNVAPPDARAWDDVVLKTQLFDQLIANTDRNLSNILVTKEFDLRLVDHGRAFRPRTELRNPAQLTRFSRSLLAGLGKLELGEIRRQTGQYLMELQMTTLLQRREAIISLAQARVAASGESVLYR